MKKIFLFLSISVLTYNIISCSKDDNAAVESSKGTLKCDIDGVTKTFSNIQTVNSGTETIITASNGTSAPTEQITFAVEPDKIGTSEVLNLGFTYLTNNKVFSADESTFNFDITLTENNSSSKSLKGSFSGDFNDLTGEAAGKKITNGKFEIKL